MSDQNTPNDDDSKSESPWPIYGQDNQSEDADRRAVSRNAQNKSVDMKYPQSGGESGTVPSRTGAIWTLIVGIVVMVVVAPATLALVMMNTSEIGSISDGSLTVPNGGKIVVDETGIVAVSPLSGTAIDCALTDTAGNDIELTVDSISKAHVGTGIPEGNYTIHCGGVPDGENLMHFSGDGAGGFLTSMLTAFGWASFVGVVGLAVTIVGIVWLIRRNRLRREHQYRQTS